MPVSSQAYTPAGEEFGVGVYEQARAGLNTPEAEEVCAGEEATFYQPVTAEILKVRLRGSCSDALIEAPPPDDVEMCKFEGMGSFALEEPAPDMAGPVPASFELSSYTMNFMASKSVERNIELFTNGLRERFSSWLARSGMYLDMMQNILREEGVPDDIAYLPLIESGYNTKAYSRMKAAGPWQFIEGTARRYGLKVDWWVDERRDPVKSTRAAARYLRDLHEMFDSWSLALAAYNAGENKIKRAITRTESDDFWRLVKTDHLKGETKNYVPKFIAARLIAVDPEAYGFYDLRYEEGFTYDEVMLEGSLTLDLVARCSGSTVETIKFLNPELRRWSTPPVKNYSIRIPRGTREQFLAKLAQIPRDRRLPDKVHRVRRGETVSQIAGRTGVPASAIISYNKLNRKGFIREGQKLIIPMGLRDN